MELIEQLMQFGLTRQEATIYMTLHAEGDLTGYEVAKLTGISRSNVYTGLAGLVEKGVAYVKEEGVTKYTPVKFEEFSRNYLNALTQTREAIVSALPVKQKKEEGFITIRGNKNIFNKICNMLCETEFRVYMVLRTEVLKQLEEQIEELIQSEVKVVILTDAPYKKAGATIYLKESIDTQIQLICDSQKVMTGQLDQTKESTCLYSQNQNLIDVFKAMLQNEITLINLSRSEQ